MEGTILAVSVTAEPLPEGLGEALSDVLVEILFTTCFTLNGNWLSQVMEFPP